MERETIRKLLAVVALVLVVVAMADPIRGFPALPAAVGALAIAELL